MLRRLQEAAQGMVKLVTLAAEQPGAMEFIRRPRRTGSPSPWGTPRRTMTPPAPPTRRAPGRPPTSSTPCPPSPTGLPEWWGRPLTTPECRWSSSATGCTSTPRVVRAVFQLFGAQRVILISDSLRATGMPDGRYPFGGQEIEVQGNRATMVGDANTLAGSVSDLMGCLKSAVSFGIPLADAVRAAAVNPARAWASTAAGQPGAGQAGQSVHSGREIWSSRTYSSAASCGPRRITTFPQSRPRPTPFS